MRASMFGDTIDRTGRTLARTTGVLRTGASPTIGARTQTSTRTRAGPGPSGTRPIAVTHRHIGVTHHRIAATHQGVIPRATGRTFDDGRPNKVLGQPK